MSEVIADGRWLAHRYDEVSDSIQFRCVDRDRHRSVAFLHDKELEEEPIAVFPRGEALGAALEIDPPAPRFIFHSAFCCSTLLARAFDLPGVAMGMSEPPILTDVIQLQLGGHDPRHVAAVLDAALTLLARPLAPGEINVIKPSNVSNSLIRVVLAMRPQARALLLYAPLESLVASIAQKDVEGRAWARELMWKLIRLGQVSRFNFSEEELYRQSDLQAAAVGWLAQHASFAELVPNPQVRTLESEVLIARPGDVMNALKRHFGLEFDAEALIAGPVFHQHSKTGTAYTAEQRKDAKAERVAIHQREIDMVLEWGRRVAEFSGVPPVLGGPLLPDASAPAF